MLILQQQIYLLPVARPVEKGGVLLRKKSSEVGIAGEVDSTSVAQAATADLS